MQDWIDGAALGSAEAYHRCVRPLGRQASDQFYAEGVPAARLHGALDVPEPGAGLLDFLCRA